ncbi:methionyl-tRNA formyltransferase [Salegentibacter sediminis]|uniref:methionyl-tRNA formyltransferase n=1 Tax=Salegentibacter sediminis TaxID=1930251 RepID=UPI0009BF17B3|nr:methionyl-tRNA formyltransferase [Salegentibacter sediminis]
MKDLKIVFMGTPQFAVHCLEEILRQGFNVVGVVTAPDKPAGRGRKLQESAVKQFAVENNLKLLQPINLKSEDFLEDLRKLHADVQVVVAFRMLPKEVWAMPKNGTFNLHASLLPQYRGAAPINWALMNGEKTTGVSTFFLDEKIDTGAMILQEEVEITPEENMGQLHDKLMHTGAKLITRTLKQIEEGEIKSTPQAKSSDLKEAPKLSRENTRIDWTQNLQKVYNHIRGLNPYPAAWSILKNNGEELKVKIFDCHKEPAMHKLPAGKIKIEDKNLKVALQDGFLVIEEIQLPGKRKMKIKDLLNGFNFSAEAKFL